MFDRWKKTHKAVYEVESENLAVPEVHIREDDTAAHDTKEPEAEEEITYENVAIPEVHTHKTHEEMTENENEQSSVNYDNLAIPEVHIRKK